MTSRSHHPGSAEEMAGGATMTLTMQADAYAGFNRLYEAGRKGGPIVRGDVLGAWLATCSRLPLPLELEVAELCRRSLKQPASPAALGCVRTIITEFRAQPRSPSLVVSRSGRGPGLSVVSAGGQWDASTYHNRPAKKTRPSKRLPERSH
jgi:hypothetical protein